MQDKFGGGCRALELDSGAPPTTIRMLPPAEVTEPEDAARLEVLRSRERKHHKRTRIGEATGPTALKGICPEYCVPHDVAAFYVFFR